MKELLEVMINLLIDNPNSVSITERNKEDIIIYEVKVQPDDIGKVIGKQGKMANSIRTIMKSVAYKEHKKVSVEFKS